MDYWVVVFLLSTLCYAIYKYLTRHFDYFKDRGIPYEPGYPIVGSMVGVVLGRKSFADWSKEMARKHRNDRVYGIMDFGGSPRYVIREPELVREMGIKAFDHFVDHEMFAVEGVDSLFNESLFNMKGQKWRDMRATLSPAFTGSKMRMMFTLVNEICEETNEFLLNRHKQNEGKPFIIGVKDIFSKFTMSVISSCAFGLKVDCLSNPKHEIFVRAKKAIDFNSAKTMFRFMLAKCFPTFMKLFKIGIVPKEQNDYFENLFLQTIQERKEKNIFRPDVAQLLLQAMEGTLKHEDEKQIDDDAGFAIVQESELGRRKVERKWLGPEIAAQAFIFFVAGSEGITQALQFAFYEIAVNMDVQKNLLEEIDQIVDDLHGKSITYDKLQRMQFLDAVVSETLRIHIGTMLDRVCNHLFTFEGDNGQMVTIEKGAKLWFQSYDIHHNEKYYSKPEKFDPWRFIGERKKEINPNAYLPFGIGPRNCIGSRFALMEVKGLLFSVLSKFRVEVCDKTMVPMRYMNTLNNVPERPIYLELRPRNGK